jgi:hypothetical protein
MSFEDDFLNGQRDCMDGIPHKESSSAAYTRGYGTQYTKEQIDSERLIFTNKNERISSPQRG